MASVWPQGSVVSCKQQKAIPMFTTEGHTLLQAQKKGSPQDRRATERMALGCRECRRQTRTPVLPFVFFSGPGCWDKLPLAR